MPKRANPECQRCAAQSAEVAQAKSCWKGQPCHSKRSYYAKHSVNKAKKLGRHRANRAQQLTELDIPLYDHQPVPEVLITFYRDRADGPIHAVEFSVIDQGKAISQVRAIHLKGVPQAKLRSHIKNVLGLLNAQFGAELPVSKGRQPSALCPLCLKHGGDDGEPQ